MLTLLDYLLELAHILLIIFNLTGWVFKKTRVVHRITLGLTFLSWFGLGYFYGLGYCPLTDWHWNVKYKLGVKYLPNSYIKYLVDRLFQVDSPTLFIDVLTFTAFALAAVLAVIMWRRERK